MTIGIGVVGAILLWVVPFNLYYLRDDNDGEVLWKADEAYLFMSVARRGYRLNLLEYPWMVFEEWLNAPPRPSDQRMILTVIRVTPSGIERHIGQIADHPADIASFFTPLNGTIYARCRGTLCRWVGDHFADATRDDELALGGSERLSSDSDEKINGWSKRGIGAVSGDFQFSIELGNKVSLTVHQGNLYRSATDSAIVYLERVGQPPQELWHVSGQPRMVTKRAYEEALSIREKR